ncbi:MAG: iron-sulfur cluster repair di-iron protein [Acidimicrobiales bacterium]
MNTLSPDDTLGDLVTSHPVLAGTLDELGLDFCCGGDRTLGDATAAAGLDVDDVIPRLEIALAGPVPDLAWTTMGMSDLVDHLERTHHAYLHRELPRLDALADKVRDVHAARHPELHHVRRLVAELRAELEPHLLREERVLFPLVRQLADATVLPDFACGTLRNPVSVLLAEHDAAGDLLEEIRDAAGRFVAPDDGCASYRALYAGLAELEADTHLHVHKENNLLFPAVLAAEHALEIATP